MHIDYETLLAQCGFTMAIEPLRQLFASENLDDPQVQFELAREVVERTVAALTVFTKPRVVH
jgi:hypothetical protein